MHAIQHLCIDAERDLRSPRYAFAFGSHGAVEPVRQVIVDRGLASWRYGDRQLSTAWGQAILLGSELPAGWPFERVVMLCSGGFPSTILVKSMPNGTRMVLFFDPRDPPACADELRPYADEDRAGSFHVSEPRNRREPS